MNLKSFLLLIGLLLLSFLGACAQSAGSTSPPASPSIPSTSTALPSTLTPIIIPSTPTATPAPTITPTPTKTLVLATDPQQIIGFWHGVNQHGFYQMFNADGTCWSAKVRDVPIAECTYYFEGTNLYISFTPDVDSSLPPCGLDDVIYQVEVISKDKIRFINVNDTCTPRISTMAQEHYKNP